MSMISEQTVEVPSDAGAPKRELNGHVLWALIMLGTLSGFNLVDRGLLSLNLEPIKLELNATDTQMSIATGIGFFLLNAIAGVPLARLADRYSRRDVIAIGFGFYSLIMGMIGAVTSFPGLLVSRMLQGIGEASGVAPASAMINDLVSPRNRRKALAGSRVFSAIIVMGMLTSLGHVADVYGWRASFYVLAVPAVVLVPLLMFTVREPARETTASGQPISRVTFREAWSRWRRSPAFLLVMTGFAVSGVTLQANGAWAGAFLARVRELSPSEIGTLAGISRGPAYRLFCAARSPLALLGAGRHADVRHPDRARLPDGDALLDLDAGLHRHGSVAAGVAGIADCGVHGRVRHRHAGDGARICASCQQPAGGPHWADDDRGHERHDPAALWGRGAALFDGDRGLSGCGRRRADLCCRAVRDGRDALGLMRSAAWCSA
jgi:MFS family permease